MALENRSWISRVAEETGFAAISGSCRDVKLLCLQRLIRLFAYGVSFLILVQFLSGLGISDGRIGLFMTLTLLGDMVISFVLTTITDAVGRRRVLAVGALLIVLSGLGFFLAENYWILVVASVFGVISPSGNEIGPFRAIEESILAQLTDKEHRSDIFAWYTLFGTAGAAIGTLTCGWAVQGLRRIEGWSDTAAYRTVFLLYAVLGAIKLGFVLLLSPAVEAERQTRIQEAGTESEGLLSAQRSGNGEETEGQQPAVSTTTPPVNKPIPRKGVSSLIPHISPASRSILWRLLLLFCLDSFASGMASPSWLTYFFTTVHSLQPSSLGTLFLVSNLLATASNLAALPLARRIGPLKTMVFTHLPSAIFLAAISLPPASPSGTWMSMAFLALRACTQSMDQAPRQAFLAAVVLPAERTAVLGVVNIVKTFSQAGGIGVAGPLVNASLWTVLLGGAGAMKAMYDLIMLLSFWRLKDRENPVLPTVS
ncbi:hypothetical protein PG989_013616 [Apiospora arundinis]